MTDALELKRRATLAATNPVLLQREAVVKEARSWVGVPYHHNAHLKGVGVDCVWLLIECYKLVIPALADFKPGNYSREWYLHHSEELYLGGVMKYARQIESPLPGDVALYKVGRCVSHGAIIVDSDFLIHANRKARQVEITERRNIELVECFHSYWTPFA